MSDQQQEEDLEEKQKMGDQQQEEDQNPREAEMIEEAPVQLFSITQNQEMRDVEDTNRNTTNDYCVKRLEPVIGMEFDNEDIAYEFYNRYAGDICFSIRKFWHNKSLTNVICTKEFVCSREVSCSCKKFEFVGILCRHTLKVLDHNNIKELPSHYILKRWTRHATNIDRSWERSRMGLGQDE
ncbi:uncharacterized protein [Oryza sativa Japonica Group]|uniref:uncharacterized protein n=1 Tax=Oryza sativa subsp. japonica TaxID=39947 RepID=UPI00339D06E2